MPQWFSQSSNHFFARPLLCELGRRIVLSLQRAEAVKYKKGRQKPSLFIFGSPNRISLAKLAESLPFKINSGSNAWNRIRFQRIAGSKCWGYQSQKNPHLSMRVVTGSPNRI